MAFHPWRAGAFSLLAAAALAACNDPGLIGVAGVREATAAEVGACRYVSNISMKPSAYGPLAEEGLKYARNRVLADAKSMGANTVVFDPVTPGIPVGEVTAVAYTC